MKILIIEDDQSVAELERDYLEINGGFQCDLHTDGTQGLQAALTEDYALVIVDVMLPGLSGFEICRRLREEKDTPVIIISALADDIDKVRGLGLGADDYMTKPFSPSELVARVKGHIQRYQRLVGSREKPRPEILKVRGLEIDRESRRVWVNGKEVNMTSKEYDLLLFLTGSSIACGGWMPMGMCPPSPSTSSTSGIKLSSTPTAPSTSKPSGAWATAFGDKRGVPCRGKH